MFNLDFTHDKKSDDHKQRYQFGSNKWRDTQRRGREQASGVPVSPKVLFEHGNSAQKYGSKNF